MKILKLIGCILIAEVAGGIGAIFTTPAIDSWYVTLAKPSLNPPNYLFAPVWTALFALMGVALYLVWQSKRKNMWAYIIFFTQLILNILWSVLFFGLHSIAGAFVEIIILWILIIVNIIFFWRINRWASIALLPYVIWVSFASILNFAILGLN